eukprot:5132309-Prymnesium_polylepis.1
MGSFKEFAIVLLSALGPGQSISATDDGWRTDVSPNAFGFYLYTSHVVHTANDDEPAGTVLTASNFSALLDFYDVADQVLVYQGSQVDPAFLCALDNSG